MHLHGRLGYAETRRCHLCGTYDSPRYADYAGNVSDSRLSLRWYPTKIFGFGAAYSRTRIDLDIERQNGTVNLDYIIQGPSIFVTFAIPGLK